MFILCSQDALSLLGNCLTISNKYLIIRGSKVMNYIDLENDMLRSSNNNVLVITLESLKFIESCRRG